jgi:ferric-dicitrate binding protein FerR (iron transport regulator)
MKKDLQLKVQSWLDGELPEREARQVGEWIARNAEASALAAELGSLKQAMLRNETGVALDESREFYWNKIERQIQREAERNLVYAPTPWYARWRKFMAPALGVAALACVMMVAVRQAVPPSYDEISTTIDGMEAVTFHDQSSQTTIIWLQDNTQATVEQKPVPPSAEPHDEPESVIDM